MKSVLVTGGCGFIGSNFLNYMVQKYPDILFINVDRMDYCAHSDNITISEKNNYKFYKTDIVNIEFISHILKAHSIDTIVHFAAQSHVDNSFGNSLSFTKDNVLGTHCLLEAFRQEIKGRDGKFLFVHVSTDEVYGEIKTDEKSTEKSLLNPTNPYASSKAAAEFMVRSYHLSFGIPIIITRGNNVYGINQYPEKVIPKFTMQLLNNEKITIQGKGDNLRTFIHVNDVVTAFETILQKGEVGKIYNIGTNDEYSVMEIAEKLIKMIKGEEKSSDIPSKMNISFIKDRDFNDIRYSLDSTLLKGMGWEPIMKFEEGLKDVVEWYRKNGKRYNTTANT